MTDQNYDDSTRDANGLAKTGRFRTWKEKREFLGIDIGTGSDRSVEAVWERDDEGTLTLRKLGTTDTDDETR